MERSKYPTNPKDFPKSKKEMKDMIEEKGGQYIHSKNWRLPMGISLAYEEGWDRIFKKVVGTKPHKKMNKKSKLLKNNGKTKH